MLPVCFYFLACILQAKETLSCAYALAKPCAVWLCQVVSLPAECLLGLDHAVFWSYSVVSGLCDLLRLKYTFVENEGTRT